jgi:hypothetical protein
MEGFMTTHSQLRFSEARGDAVAAIDAIASGRGWCNVVPIAVDDVPDLKVNLLGFWLNSGVPVASYVTTAPRHGEAQPSSLGLLHSRGRLGRTRIAELLGGAPFIVQQDKKERGLVMAVPIGIAASLILDTMCTMTESLCEYEMTGDWRMDLFVR